jgi:hypothetical protein
MAGADARALALGADASRHLHFVDALMAKISRSKFCADLFGLKTR